MTLRANGSYIGPRDSAVSVDAASGVWDLRTAQRYQKAGTWPTVFEPDNVPGLQLWLDASDSSTLYDATTGGSLVAADGTVKRWEDKSGNARHATEASNGPQRKAAVENGLDVLRFDGSDDSLTSADFLDLAAGEAITAFVVAKRGATDATHSMLSKFNNTGSHTSEDGWSFRFLSDNKLNAAFAKDAAYAQRTSNSPVTASSLSVLAFKATSGSLTTSTVLYQDGLVVGFSTSGSVQTLDNTAYPVIIGRLPFQGVDYYFFNGDIAEIIIYDSALSDTDREAVENYLLAKWGIV